MDLEYYSKIGEQEDEYWAETTTEQKGAVQIFQRYNKHRRPFRRHNHDQ